MPVGPVNVVLHQVGRAAQGPIDTVRTDARGRFNLRFRPDTAASYLLSVRYRGMEYFSQPVSADPARPDTALVVVVADTSTSTPIRVSERTVLVTAPDESGSRTVIDWLVLDNPGDRTRIASDSIGPSWAGVLPPEAQNVALADLNLSQFSPDAVVFRRDSILLFAPLSPGRKELVLQYRVPQSERTLTVPTRATDSIYVLLEELDARIERPVLVRGPASRMENRVFTRWAGRLRDGQDIALRFVAPGVSAQTVLVLLLAATAGGFALLFVRQVRAGRAAAPFPLHPAFLADRIALLDESHAAQSAGGRVTSEATHHYQEERARLTQALARALAVRRRDS